MQGGATFDIFLGVLHPFVHDECATALHGHIAIQPCMASQLKRTAILHGHIHLGIGVVPILHLYQAVLIPAGGRAPAVNRVHAAENHGAFAHMQTTTGILAQIGMDAVERPGAAALVINKQRASGTICERTQPGSLISLPVGEGHILGGRVGNHRLFREGVDGEGFLAGLAIGGIPLHAVAPHIQRTATGAEG